MDISKRLSRLEISWKDSQFTDIVQLKTIALVKGSNISTKQFFSINNSLKLYFIFTAIKINDYAEANRLQMALMVDHTRQCNTWIPAIRQLINQQT